MIIENKDSLYLVCLSLVDPYYGFYYDINAISFYCKRYGIKLVLDLAHSFGSVPIDLKKWKVDGACICGYKYFCGGPGAPGFVYLNESHFEEEADLTGWMAKNRN